MKNSASEVSFVEFNRFKFMKQSTFNPNAPAYIPGGLVYTREGPCGVVSSNQKITVPTAKVPNYVKRLGQGMRDNRPGLLPTPSIPPMRVSTAAPMGFSTPLGGSGIYQRSAPLSPLDDAYATPYATKLTQCVKMEDYETSAGSCDVSPPPGFDTISHASLISATPPGFENMKPPSISSPQQNSADVLSSLLSLLSQQLIEPEGKDALIDSVVLSTAVSSIASTAAPCSPISSQPYKPLVGTAKSQREWQNHHDRVNTADSEQSILDSIAGFYLPSNLN